MHPVAGLKKPQFALFVYASLHGLDALSVAGFPVPGLDDQLSGCWRSRVCKNEMQIFIGTFRPSVLRQVHFLPRFQRHQRFRRGRVQLHRAGQPQRVPPQGRMQTLQRLPPHPQAGAIQAGISFRCQEAPGFFAEIIVLVREDAGCPPHGFLRLGEPGCDGGQNPVAEIVPQVIVPGVGFVLHPRNAFLCQRGADDFRGHVQQGPPQQQFPAFRPFAHPRQPARAAAPEQMQQHGFRLVPPVMGQGQHSCAVFQAGFPQRFIPCPARRVLAFAFNPHPADLAGNAQILAHFRHERRVPARGFPQAVVYVGGGQFHAFCPGQLSQRLQQRHRIRPARHRCRHAARSAQIFPGFCNPFQQKMPFLHTALLYPGNAGNARESRGF